MERLLEYFLTGAENCTLGDSVGAEVETSFLDGEGEAITAEHSQRIFMEHMTSFGWRVLQRKGSLVSEITDEHGNRIGYELGCQNIELATTPGARGDIVPTAQEELDKLYQSAARVGAFPHFHPVLHAEKDLLVIPDERDAIWLQLDGRPALELLARTSSVQFTFAVSPGDAIRCINRLGSSITEFLGSYPQDDYWRRYIRESRAQYHHSRYGGPLIFTDVDDYCQKLREHSVVSGVHLVPYEEVVSLDISLFLRSIWWYFRLKRYGKQLCIEVRPQPRLTDGKLQSQLDLIFDVIS